MYTVLHAIRHTCAAVCVQIMFFSIFMSWVAIELHWKRRLFCWSMSNWAVGSRKSTHFDRRKFWGFIHCIDNFCTLLAVPSMRARVAPWQRWILTPLLFVHISAPSAERRLMFAKTQSHLHSFTTWQRYYFIFLHTLNRYVYVSKEIEADDSTAQQKYGYPSVCV